jgi:hypothetical protein
MRYTEIGVQTFQSYYDPKPVEEYESLRDISEIMKLRSDALSVPDSFSLKRLKMDREYASFYQYSELQENFARAGLSCEDYYLPYTKLNNPVNQFGTERFGVIRGKFTAQVAQDVKASARKVFYVRTK